ncbi:MAG: AAA family ATPase [SAR324 cluster bacterium]|uniref:AAA family ATPase n=1 Tax=SAR324 cluster bacterium TaxID=2024889 RepID=A0A7X9IL79_9DELT|nr:AAA family ATPase [SAR324 cluster bacterium]
MREKPDYSKIHIHTAEEFLDLELPKIQFLVGDWLPRNGSLLVGGAPKVGKSWFVYYMADAIARGQRFLKWECAEGKAVIIDCDNRPQTVQHRLALMGNGLVVAASKNLRIITRETFTDNEQKFPNFRDRTELLAVFDLVGEADIVFLDNVNLAFPGGNENESVFWNDLEGFILEARRRGMTIVVVHHTPKANPYDFSGSHKQCRVVESGVILGKIGVDAGREAHFNVVFKFMREMSEQTESFSAQLTREDTILNWKLGSFVEPLSEEFTSEDPRKAQIRFLKMKGYTYRQIESETGIPRATVWRWAEGASASQCPNVPATDECETINHRGAICREDARL